MELALDEVWVKVVVADDNDNTPAFLPHGRPIVAAVPSTAAYGHFVTRIVVSDGGGVCGCCGGGAWGRSSSSSSS